MKFDHFSVVTLKPAGPEFPNFVYVLCWINGSEEVPFFIGKTSRIRDRLNYYSDAMLSASNGSRVVERIKHWRDKGYRIVVRFKSSTNSQEEELEMVTNPFGGLTIYDVLRGDQKRDPQLHVDIVRVRKWFLDEIKLRFGYDRFEDFCGFLKDLNETVDLASSQGSEPTKPVQKAYFDAVKGRGKKLKEETLWSYHRSGYTMGAS